MMDDIDEPKTALPESLFYALRNQSEYGRKALADMVESSRYGAEKYFELLAMYEAAREENLDPEFTMMRHEHCLMLTEFHDLYARTLANLEQLRDRLG